MVCTYVSVSQTSALLVMGKFLHQTICSKAETYRFN